MSDEVVVEAAEQQQQQQNEEPAAPKLPPGERVKRPVRPDDTETKASIDALQASSECGRGLAFAIKSILCSLCSRPRPPGPAVVKNKRRIEEIKETIDNKRGGRSKASQEQQAVKNKLAELRGQFQQLVVRAGACRACGWAAAAAAVLPPPAAPTPSLLFHAAACTPPCRCPCACCLLSNAATMRARAAAVCPLPPTSLHPHVSPWRRARRTSCARSWMWRPRRARARAPP